jgi:hypothetical protein
MNIHWISARRTAAIASMLIASAPTLRAQQGPLATLSRPARTAVERTADSLRVEGLPGDAVVARAAEGILKGADEPRILGAVHRLASELRAGRAAIGNGATSSEIVAAASALHAGASAEMIRQLHAAAPDGPSGRLTVPLVVLADLVSRGTPVKVAGESVASLLSHRATDDDFQLLRAGVERDIFAGNDPAAAALARTRAVTQSLGAAPPDRRTTTRPDQRPAGPP